MTVKFTTWINQGLGIMIFPNIGQIGIIFFIWAIIIRIDPTDFAEIESADET